MALEVRVSKYEFCTADKGAIYFKRVRIIAKSDY
jgi:hypothetical protein